MAFCNLGCLHCVYMVLCLLLRMLMLMLLYSHHHPLPKASKAMQAPKRGARCSGPNFPPHQRAETTPGYHQIASSFSINHVDFANLPLEPTVFVRFRLFSPHIQCQVFCCQETYAVHSATRVRLSLCPLLCMYMQVNASDKVNVTSLSLLPSLRQRRTSFSGRKSLGL
ncbi:hypothetical protein V8C40DRAFT_235443, partial [Trichoderma camerunense]